jgi:hypothetical protein
VSDKEILACTTFVGLEKKFRSHSFFLSFFKGSDLRQRNIYQNRSDNANSNCLISNDKDIFSATANFFSFLTENERVNSVGNPKKIK